MDVLESTHVLAPTERPTPLHPRQRVVRETEVAPERERLVGPAEGRAVVAHRRCPVRLQRIVTDEFLPGRQSFEFGDGLVEQTLIGVPWCNRRHDDREHYLRVGCLSRHCLRHEAPGSPTRRARAPAQVDPRTTRRRRGRSGSRHGRIPVGRELQRPLVHDPGLCRVEIPSEQAERKQSEQRMPWRALRESNPRTSPCKGGANMQVRALRSGSVVEYR